MERKHCLAGIALSMIAAALLTLLCLILNDHTETQAETKVRQMAGRVNANTASQPPAHPQQRLPQAVSTAQR